MAKHEAHAIPAQPLSSLEGRILSQGKTLLTRFAAAGRPDHRRYQRARRIYALDDDELDAGKRLSPGERTPQLPQLVTSIRNAVADMCDNVPEVLFFPETEGLEEVARDLTDIMGYTLEQRQFAQTYRQVCEDKFVTGVGVYQIFWDETLEPGGGIDVIRWPAEALYTDPTTDDYRQGRAIFKVSRHPRSWFAEHYPNQYRYIGADEPILMEEASFPDDEPMIHLVEYWYRRYDASRGRYTLHSAHLAGGALLDASEPTAPQGVYLHGRYPFVLDGYRQVSGRYLGMIDDLYPLQEAANRYARYEDRNARLSSRQRFLVNEASGLNAADVADCDQEILTARTINESAVRQLAAAPLNPQIPAAKLRYLEMIKEESGQNLFNRGETGGGVTAASAIQALQEAGNKISRSNLAATSQAVASLSQQALWLMCQFFQPRRSFYLTGRSGGLTRLLTEARTVGLSSREITAGFGHPPYLARVQIRKSNPLRIQARNELILQAAQYAQKAGTGIRASVLFQMLNLEGDTDELVRILEEEEKRAASSEAMTPMPQSSEDIKSPSTESRQPGPLAPK